MEVLNHLNNYSTYKEWNKYLAGIIGVRKDQPDMATFLYYKTFVESDGQIELKVRRRKQFNNIIEYIERDNILRVISVETGKRGNCTRISIYLPLYNLVENKVPITLVKSTLDCLSQFNLYLTHLNFNKESSSGGGNNNNIESIEEQPFDASLDTERNSMYSIETRKKSKGIYKKAVSSGNIDTRLPSIERIPEEVLETSIKQIEAVKEEPKVIDPNEQENEECRKLCEEKLKEFEEYYNRPWKVLDEKKDYKILYFDEKIGIRSIRSEAVINRNYKDIYEFIQLFEKKCTYDKNFDHGKTIRFVDDDLAINYLKYKGKLMISPRDFVIISRRNFTEDEAYIFGANYVNDKYPKHKGIERADLKFGYYHMKKIDENKTLFTYYTLVILF
jgi:hypothetical protein